MLGSLLPSRSGVGNLNAAAHPRPLPQAGGETDALDKAGRDANGNAPLPHRQSPLHRPDKLAGDARIIWNA